MKSINFFNRGKKRDNEDDQSTKYPRIKITKLDNTAMDIDNSGHHSSLTPSPSSPCPSPSYSISNYNNDFYNPQYYSQETTVMTVSSYASCASYASYAASQDDFEVSSSLKKMSIDSILEKSNDAHDNQYLKTNSVSGTTAKGMCVVAQSLDEFVPLVGKFFRLGEEIIILYEKAKHNKELCGFLLKRCNCAMAAVRDLDIRKAENMEFFSKRENYIMFVEFVECMRKMRKFVSRVSKLHKLVKYFMATSIEDDFTSLVAEFDGYMNSLNFSFMLQSRDELSKLSKMRDEIRQIKEVIFNALEIPDDKQSCQDFLKKMDLVTEKNIEFQTQNRNADTNSDELITIIEANEPLLDGKLFQKAATHSKRIEKRTSFKSCDEYCFKEFSSSSDQSQIEIRRQVNILKELKDSDHIIRFYGVAKEDSKYYLVTEWMEHGNLHEYYTRFRDSINLQTKIKFALDICRGVAYLHECKILHHDIQSANILINAHDKVRIANFGLSKKFSDITRNITHNLENIRYMAPEKLLLDNEEDNNGVKKKKVPYDSKCEIYSVGTLLWEIAELKKPHSDLDKSDMLVSIRKRVSERYPLPFSSDIPCEWEYIVSRAMEYEPTWRLNISDICRDFYKLSKKYKYRSYDPTSQTYADIECLEEDDENASIDDNQSPSPSYITIKILTVEDAIRAHKSKNGSRQLAWQSFKHHSSTNIEAKYWLGYYYYHDKEIPELQQIDKEERIKIAVEIFKETADKGNPSAQLRYGICLWQGEGIKANSFEALKYLKLAAGSENSTAMYIIGKAYWNGGNGIDQDKVQGAEYLKKAARHNHPKAREMCIANRIF